MADLPLPEDHIDAMLIAYAGRGFHSTRRAAMRSLLAAALAFRDESGHRAVWSAEEVEPLIEALRSARNALRNPVQTQAIKSACASIDAALARVRGPETWRHSDGSVRVDHMDARPGDYFGPETCPTCGSTERDEQLCVFCETIRRGFSEHVEHERIECSDSWHTRWPAASRKG